MVRRVWWRLLLCKKADKAGAHPPARQSLDMACGMRGSIYFECCLNFRVFAACALTLAAVDVCAGWCKGNVLLVTHGDAVLAAAKRLEPTSYVDNVQPGAHLSCHQLLMYSPVVASGDVSGHPIPLPYSSQV